ncbi:hypothetical protein P3T73_09945 [Kiritimatiellota bacterium B12222]|nr:hypothetical protein P3T73_09945 [Kiritimatiellota bacterium B12222]
MNAPTSSSSLLETLDSYLRGLEESGISSVELTQGFPVLETVPVAPKPRQQPAPVPVVEAAAPAQKPLMPPPPPAKPVVEAVTQKLVWCTLMRMVECEDQIASTETTVVLVTSAEEFEELNGKLLLQILKAAGYAPLATPMKLTHPEDISGAGTRILVMGNEALHKISPAGMDLKIVRGMWQNTPYGKLISTFPPSVLHDNPPGKKAVWQDLKNLLKDMNLTVPDWARKNAKK